MTSTQNPVGAPHPTASLAGITVLLVEDEPDMAQLLALVLLEAGATVVQVTQAEDALSLIAHKPPDLLLSNIKLPHQDGTWLIQQLRTHPSPQLKQLPAIAVTSYTREVCGDIALDFGFDRFLPKDGSFEDLVREIAELVQAHQ